MKSLKVTRISCHKSQKTQQKTKTKKKIHNLDRKGSFVLNPQ